MRFFPVRGHEGHLSPRGAERVRKAIASAIQRLSAFPHIGRETDIPDVRVLSTVRFPFLIFHTLAHKEIIVVHIRHSARDTLDSNDT